jgi:hypothetical protein
VIQKDARFRALHKISERRQAFNAYKAQRAKEERDDRRLFIKRAKDELDEWLRSPDAGLTAHITYKRAQQLFAAEPRWNNVPVEARKEIFDDVHGELQRQHKEAQKTVRKRNIKSLADILDAMDITHETTWAQAQRQLAENDVYMRDKQLQGAALLRRALAHIVHVQVWIARTLSSCFKNIFARWRMRWNENGKLRPFENGGSGARIASSSPPFLSSCITSEWAAVCCIDLL